MLDLKWIHPSHFVKEKSEYKRKQTTFHEINVATFIWSVDGNCIQDQE
jgi:hypothetical protein